MIKTFGEFVNKKKRDMIKQLGIIEQCLRKQGLKVESFLHNDEDDPYIFCFNPAKNTSFDGIRIYKIGGQIAFRIQKESQTHPYGRAYAIPVEEMFQDFLSDDGVKNEEAAKKVVESIINEVLRFFQKSEAAEKQDRRDTVVGNADNAGGILMKSQGTDYSNMIFNKGN